MQPTFKLTNFANTQHNMFLKETRFAPATSQTSPNAFFNAGQKGSFLNVMANVAGDLNRSVEAPNELMKRSLTSNDVDVHEIMIAVAKADMAINVSTQVLTKVIQAYERVQQIQV